MSNLIYLIGIALFVMVASTLLVLRDRKPTSVEYGVRAFSKGMNALAPRDTGALSDESHHVRRGA